MYDIPALSSHTIVLIGERLEGSLVNWGKQHDGSTIDRYTEGQFRALFLRIRRLMLRDDFVFETVFNLDQDEDIFLVKQTIVGRQIIFCVILREAAYKFNDPLTGIIKTVASRSGIYSAKELHEQIFEALERHQNQDFDDVVVEEFSTMEALVYLETKNLADKSKEFLSILLNALTSQSDITSYLHSKPVFEATLLMLTKIIEGDDPDIILDSAYLMAINYKDSMQFYYASKVFDRIAEFAIKFDRLTLEISCRIQQADIIKIQEDQDPSEILNILSNIDDGSLEVASAFDKEVYYCLQGYAYDKMQDYMSAEDFFLMATMIAEVEGRNSIYLADAHGYLGELHLKRFEVDTAIRSFIAASSIANANNQPDLSISFQHRAGVTELIWSKMLASSALIELMDGNIDGTHHGWRALKHLMKAVRYTSPKLRQDEFNKFYPEILMITENVLTRKYDEYTEQTIAELKQHCNIFSKGELHELEERELINYLELRISAKLPVPDPIIMIIANDGRLITGGEINSADWSTSAFSGNDDLLSGALSAIMALLSEVITTSNPLKMIDAGATSIMIEKSQNCIGALLIDRDVIILRRALKDVLMQFEIKYPSLDHWDGYSLDFTPMKKLINERFNEALASLSEG